MTLAEKVAQQRERRAVDCERLAGRHGTGEWARLYRHDAETWRAGAAAARAGNLDPLYFGDRS